MKLFLSIKSNNYLFNSNIFFQYYENRCTKEVLNTFEYYVFAILKRNPRRESKLIHL